MLTPWANHAALVAFGLTIGALGYVQQLLTPVWVSAGMHDRGKRKPGESYYKSLRRENDEQTERLAEARRRSPAFRWVSNAVLALIAVLILMIVFSSVEVEWWWLIGSVVAGGLLAAGSARLARSGRFIGLVRESGRFDLSALSDAVAAGSSPPAPDPSAHEQESG